MALHNILEHCLCLIESAGFAHEASLYDQTVQIRGQKLEGLIYESHRFFCIAGFVSAPSRVKLCTSGFRYH